MRSPFAALFERRSGPITSAHALWESVSRGSRSLAGVTVTESTALQIAAVHSCVDLIASTIATLPVDILERTDERTRTPAVTHPLRSLITRPNGWQTWAEWLRMMLAHRLLRGNGYSLIIRSTGTANGSEQITELLPLHPDQVLVEQRPYPDLSLRYEWTSSAGKTHPVAQRDMLHIRGLSTNGVTGRSVIGDACDTFGVALATQQHAATFWARSGVPSVVLRHPKTLSDSAKTSLERHFEGTYGGGADQRRVAVLEEGMDLTPISVTAEDAQFLETRKFQRGEIAGLFRVPPHMIGDTEKSTSWGTGIEQQFIGWIVTGLGPEIINLEQRLAASLLVNPARFYWKFYLQGLARGDMAARGQWYRLMREIGAFSVNEVRQLEDMNPVEDGDTRLQPMNLAPLGWEPPDAEPNQAADEVRAMRATLDAMRAAPQVAPALHLDVPVTVHLPEKGATVKRVTRDANGVMTGVVEE